MNLIMVRTTIGKRELRKKFVSGWGLPTEDKREKNRSPLGRSGGQMIRAKSPERLFRVKGTQKRIERWKE